MNAQQDEEIVPIMACRTRSGPQTRSSAANVVLLPALPNGLIPALSKADREMKRAKPIAMNDESKGLVDQNVIESMSENDLMSETDSSEKSEVDELDETSSNPDEVYLDASDETESKWLLMAQLGNAVAWFGVGCIIGKLYRIYSDHSDV